MFNLQIKFLIVAVSWEGFFSSFYLPLFLADLWSMSIIIRVAFWHLLWPRAPSILAGGKNINASFFLAGAAHPHYNRCGRRLVSERIFLRFFEERNRPKECDLNNKKFFPTVPHVSFFWVGKIPKVALTDGCRIWKHNRYSWNLSYGIWLQARDTFAPLAHAQT